MNPKIHIHSKKVSMNPIIKIYSNLRYFFSYNDNFFFTHKFCVCRKTSIGLYFFVHILTIIVYTYTYYN